VCVAAHTTVRRHTMPRATSTPPTRAIARASSSSPRERADTSARQRTNARSRAELVRLVPCAGELARAEALGVGGTRDEDDGEDDRGAHAVRRRAFFATNVIGAVGAMCAGLENAAEAFEDVPKDYARLARDVVDALTKSLEYDAANAGASPGERYKFAEPAKAAVKAYIAYGTGNGPTSVSATTSYADITEALRELSSFYKKNGATAQMASDTRERILAKLNEARESLPPPEPTIMDKLFAIGVTPSAE